MSKTSGIVGLLTPQEAFEYAIYTHAVEGIEFTADEKKAFMNNLTKGTCGQAADQAVQRFKEKYGVA